MFKCPFRLTSSASWQSCDLVYVPPCIQPPIQSHSLPREGTAEKRINKRAKWKECFSASVFSIRSKSCHCEVCFNLKLILRFVCEELFFCSLFLSIRNYLKYRHSSFESFDSFVHSVRRFVIRHYSLFVIRQFVDSSSVI